MEPADSQIRAGPRVPARRRSGVRSADALLGSGVYDRNGDRLGDVETLMLDVGSGAVAYAVLASGGFMGIGARLVPVPWACLDLDVEHGGFTLELSVEEIERAPAFDRNHWPDMSDRDWGREIHAFYGVVPYWER